jgi:RNA polymerase sigma factor (sigma-70 family)
MRRVLHTLRLAVAVTELTDGQLLESYSASRDGDAFAELVRRHGPMVWGVCRRWLANREDAEDAFQATFLVLVRKPGSVRPAERVGNWLHGVAVRAARKAAKSACRRRERQVECLPEPVAATEEVSHDLVTVIDREVARLPQKYRLPVVLCDLEGNTRRETAARLGWPEGTVAGRLALGREMLARRLARLGLAVPCGVLATALSGQEAGAAAPAGLFDLTIQAAASGTFPPEATALANGVIRAMSATKLMPLAAVALIFLGGSLTLRGQLGEQPKDPAGPAPAAANAVDPPPPRVPKDLLEKRVDAARKVYQQSADRLKSGQGLPSEMFGWSERWLDAELALAAKPADRTKALQDHLDRTREVERIMVEFAKMVGQGRQAYADAATYYRLEAEIRLYREGLTPQEPPGEKGKPGKK